MPTTGSGTGTPVTGVSAVLEGRPFFSAVWVWDNSATAYINNTLESQSTGGTAFTIFDATADFLYLGNESRFDLAFFGLVVLGSLSGITWQYYNGSTWATFVPGPQSFDAEEGASFGYNFALDGAASFDRLVNWATLAFSATNPHGATPPDTSARYWIRVSASTITTSPTVSYILARPYVVYCTATEVANLLQLSTDFSSTTIPTRNTVEDFIHSAQSRIDYYTRKSWRLNFVLNEKHPFNYAGGKLLRPYLRRITRLQIWDGSQYDTKTAGRSNEYFWIEDTSMFYYSRYFLLPARLQHNVPVGLWGWAEYTFPVRVSYLWGKDIQTDEREGGYINEIAKKLTAIDVVQTLDFGLLPASGIDKVPLDEKIRLWREDTENSLDSLRAWESF